MKKDKSNTTKLQASVDAVLYERFKVLCASKGQTIPSMIESLMEDFVEAEEEKYLDNLLAIQLEKAHRGEKVAKLVNLEKLYHEVSKTKK